MKLESTARRAAEALWRLEGPAHLDITNGIAHKLPDCPIYQDNAQCSASAAEGPIEGFEWCEVCGNEDFKPEPEDE